MQQGVFRRVVRAFMCCGLAFTLSSALTSCDRIRGTVSGPPVPVIEIETDHFFMGEIESDAIAEVFVKIFNRGESPLAITKVTTECPCTKGEMLEPVIPPGGEGILRVTVDPKRVSGHESTKTLTLFSNDPNNPTAQIAISATVKPQVVWEPKNFDFGEVPQGQGAERHVRFRQTRDSKVRIFGGLRVRNRTTFVGEVVVVPPEERVDPEKLELDLIVRLLPETPVGTHSSELIVTTNARVGMHKFNAVATVVPAAEESAEAGAPSDE